MALRMQPSYSFILVLGGGKFGSLALRRLRGRARTILVVDRDPNCQAAGYVDRMIPSLSLNDITNNGSFLLIGDCVSLLLKLIEDDMVPEFIVLTVPRNVMASLFIKLIEDEGFYIKFNSELMERISNSIPEKYLIVRDSRYGVIVVSYARYHSCIEGCTQPSVCPVSGEEHDTPIVELLRRVISKDYIKEIDYVKIFESHLIERDVGGVYGEELREDIKNFRKRHLIKGTKIAIGTACKCHGIVNFIDIT